jgi:hypothetical protein
MTIPERFKVKTVVYTLPYFLLPVIDFGTFEELVQRDAREDRLLWLDVKWRSAGWSKCSMNTFRAR